MKYLQFGNPPPPIGGVTVSIKNLHDAINSGYGKSYLRRGLWFFKRYDVGHVHASNSIKRFFHILFLRFFCKKVVFTVHGLWLKKEFFNLLSARLANGVIFLNEDLYSTWQSELSKKAIVLPSVFYEGLHFSQDSIYSVNEVPKILLYAHSRIYKNGDEVYGIEFVLKSLKMTNFECELVIVDLNGEYAEIVAEYEHSITIEYYPHEVDFKRILGSVDLYLRPTCMDGSSVAIQEALLLGKSVLASDVVDRGPNVHTYVHLNSIELILNIKKSISSPPPEHNIPSVREYIDYVARID